MQTWVVTGANRGLGLEFIRQLSSNPTNLIIATTRNPTSNLSELQSLSSKNLHILTCDTSSQTSILDFSKQVTKTLGESAKIDFLLNNAGINSVPAETALNLSAEGLQEQITTNVLGPAKVTELLLPHLQKGSVVMNMTSGMGSISAVVESQWAGSTTYSISKAALNMLSAHQSVLLKERGVVVVAMDPGWVKTDMGGEGARLEKEESIAGMLKVLSEVGIEQSGKYYEYNGNERKW